MWRGRNGPQPVEIVGEKIPLDTAIGSRYGAAVAQFHVPPRTAGLLGDNYVAITPLYSKTFFHNGGHIQDTHSAMILEKLIGQFLFSINHGKTDKGNAK